MELLIITILVTLGVILLYYIIKFLRKKNLFKIKIKAKKEKKIKENIEIGSLKVVDKYMLRREVKILVILNQFLPKEYLALPKVAIGNLILPQGNKNLYNKIKDSFIDFVVFEEKTMNPVLIVDIYDSSFEDELIKDKNPELYAILKSLGLPILEFAVRGEIDTTGLKRKLFDILNLTKQEENLKNKKE